MSAHTQHMPARYSVPPYLCLGGSEEQESVNTRLNRDGMEN